ncbi:unnamed protein product [Sympodiomycopsis kandeliae]
MNSLRGHFKSICTVASRSTTSAGRRNFTNTAITLSGSNRWSKVKHKKFAADAVKSNTFSRLTTEITAAVRSGGEIPENNAKLAVLLRKAKSLQFPKDKLEATLAKASKSTDATHSLTYEVIGPVTEGGTSVALIIECVTDSPGHNRAKFKDVLSRKQNDSARLSSVGHMFERKGVIRITPPSDKTLDEALELAIDNGAEDMKDSEPESESEAEAVGSDGVVMEILCLPTDINRISKALTDQGYHLHEAEQRMLPTGPPLRIKDGEEVSAEVQEDTAGWVDEATLAKLDRLKDMLEEDAGCTRIWSNIHGWP